MKNGSLEQFLDTGWYTESVLYYQDYVYWCEGSTDFVTGITLFTVEKWRAECDGCLYHQYKDTQGNLVGLSVVLEISGKDMDRLKQIFLTSPIFDGKTFWQVEGDLIWVEEGADYHLDS